MQDQFRTLFDHSLIYRISAAFGFFLYLAYILQIEADRIFIPSVFILLITWLGEFILIIAAQEVESIQFRNKDLILDTILSFVPTLILAKYLFSSIKSQRKIKNDIMFILGLALLLIVVLVISIILLIVIAIILWQGNYLVLLLLFWSFVGYFPIILADKYSQITEIEIISAEISRVDLLLGTLLGKLVARPSKRLITCISLLLLFAVLYIFQDIFKPLVY